MVQMLSELEEVHQLQEPLLQQDLLTCNIDY